MADSTEGETNPLYLVLVALVALIPGLLIQSFIIAVNVNDWWKGRSVTPVDHIVTSLGISRMCSQGANTFYLYTLYTVSLRNLYSDLPLAIIDVVYAFFTYTNIWLTALLSIVFCLKIVNFHNRLFLYLRRMIAQRTSYLILASILFSAFSCLIPLLMISEVTNGGTYNGNMDLFLNCTYINVLYSDTIGSFLPLLFYYISSILLFISLYYHTTRMKMSSNLTINLETYYSVMKFVSFTFIYNTMYFTGNFVCVFYYYIYCVYLPWLYMFLDLLPVLHSSYLIYRTAKLRNRMSKVLQDVINILFQWKDRATRESIEVIAQ